jgi:toxin ParE1/3/4
VKREVVLRPSALADLKGLYDFIERDNPMNAARYVDQIEAFCMKLADFPERGTRREDLGSGIRILGFRRRISIAFVVLSDRVEVARVLYGGSDLKRALGEDEA